MPEAKKLKKPKKSKILAAVLKEAKKRMRERAATKEKEELFSLEEEISKI